MGRIGRPAAAALVAVLAAAGALIVGPARPAAADPGSEEAQFLALTNRVRAAHGVAPLAWNATLTGIARNWSSGMASGRGLAHNMNLPQQVPLQWWRLGENVGQGGSVDNLEAAFEASPHHYENIVDPSYNAVGIGVVDAGGRVWVTLDFMGGVTGPVRVAPPSVALRPRPRFAGAPVQVAAPAVTAPAAAPAQVEAARVVPVPASLGLAMDRLRLADVAAQRAPPATPTVTTDGPHHFRLGALLRPALAVGGWGLLLLALALVLWPQRRVYEPWAGAFDRSPVLGATLVGSYLPETDNSSNLDN
jgi:hypothetical protein